MSSGMLNHTPPSASTIEMKPAKSTTMNASTAIPDICSTVAFTQATPGATSEASEPPSAPVNIEVLNMTSVCGSEDEPSACRQEGMSTSVSRGIESTCRRVRSAEMWTTIVESLRRPPTSSESPAPRSEFLPSRESMPSTRTLTARPSKESGVCVSEEFATKLLMSMTRSCTWPARAR